MININNLDRQVLNALHGLATGPSQALLMLLASEVTGATDRLVQATDTVSIHRLQGRVEAYNDLLGAVKDAHKGLNRAPGA